MAISKQQHDELAEMLADIKDEDLANDWQRSFIADQRKRFNEYGMDMYLSVKQWDKIKEIYAEATGVGDEPHPAELDFDDEIPF